MKQAVKTTAVIFLVIAGVLSMPTSCTHQPYVLPESQRTGDPTICFDRDILPIFQSNCAKGGCHDAGSGRAGYVLDSYDNIVKKGVVPGNVAASKIWESISFATGDNKMPRDAPGLSDASLYTIKRWIQTGAIKDTGGCSAFCDTNSHTYSGTIAPMLQTNCVGCHNSSSAPGGSLADYNSVKATAQSGKLYGSIAHLSGSVAMPQGGAMLEDCKITQVRKWIEAGMPNN
jgi:hypothetical protein